MRHAGCWLCIGLGLGCQSFLKLLHWEALVYTYLWGGIVALYQLVGTVSDR